MMSNRQDRNLTTEAQRHGGARDRAARIRILNLLCDDLAFSSSLYLCGEFRLTTLNPAL
jgi:hypothetical protein